MSSAQVVADTSGSVVIQFWDDETIHREPVIAWAIEEFPKSYYANPVVPSCNLADVHCIEVHENKQPSYWLFIEEHTFFSLAEAIEYGRLQIANGKARLQGLYK
jgi:hypothetical protein